MSYERFAAFAEEMYAPGGRGLDRLRAASAASDWPATREALWIASEIDGCTRTYEPKPRCILEDLLVQLGSVPGSVPRLVNIAERHPQRELRIRALHGLLAAGPEGIEAAARGSANERDEVASSVRARAAIVRGDGPPRIDETPRARGALSALRLGFQDLRSKTSQVASAKLLGTPGVWMDFVIAAYFDRALAESAQAVLRFVPAARWKPLVAARKRAAKKPVRAKPPTKRALAGLDAELKRMRVSIDAIVQALEAEGFAFRGTPRTPPPKAFATKLRVLERRIGKVPIAVARFWAIIGAVDLRGNHPAWKKKTWIARSSDAHWLADPLVVGSLESATADANDGDFDVKEAPAALRYALDLAGDDVTKANFSGGILSVETPTDAIDPPLVGRAGTFMEMLRESIAWRGFPGFARCADAPIRRQ